MILIDSSVWIDYFRDRDCAHVQRLERAIDAGEQLAVCGIILTEVLQGVRSEGQAKKVMLELRPLYYLPVGRLIYMAGAALFRKARSRGLVVRKTADCIIAACAIAHGAEILTTDADFTKIAAVSRLKLVKV